MKRLSELEGDDFFDVLYALSPILPALEKVELFDLLINGTDGKVTIATEKSDKATQEKSSRDALRIITQGISIIFPLLSSRENRGAIYEILRICDCVSLSDVKKYTAPKILTKIKQLFTPEDIKRFFVYADKLDSPE